MPLPLILDVNPTTIGADELEPPQPDNANIKIAINPASSTTAGLRFTKPPRTGAGKPLLFTFLYEDHA
jgi:hypothetical protein